jgi:hypothetical protein
MFELLDSWVYSLLFSKFFYPWLFFFFLMSNNFLLVTMINRRRMLVQFLHSILRLLPKGTLKRKLWWLNHHQSFLRKNLLHLLQSVRKGEQRWLLLSRYISHLLLKKMWVLSRVLDSVYSWAIRLSYNLYSVAFDAEISFSWRLMHQNSGDC